MESTAIGHAAKTIPGENQSARGCECHSQRKELLQKVTQDLASIPGHTHRVIRSRLIRTSLHENKIGITPLHHEILKLLDEEGTMHCVEIGRRLQVAKAQMTKLIDRLTALQIVERKTDPADRRMLDINLTPQGRALLIERKNNLRRAIETSMSSLTDAELEEFSVSIRKVHNILSRLE